MGKVIDLLGKTFGRLTVQLYKGLNKHNQAVWECKCSCGKQTTVVGRDLVNGHTKSCGCLHKEDIGNRTRIRPYEALYNSLCLTAKQRGNGQTLTYEDFVLYTTVTCCVYCEDTVTWAKANASNTKYGLRYNLDRKDNALGYSKENCAVCCKECNLIKGARFTFEQMLQIGALIKTWRKAQHA